LNEFYEIQKTIHASQADFTNRLRIDSLFILLQDTAALHADKLNLGFKALIEHNLAWVLSWVKVEVEAFPKFGDEIKIRTWPKKKFKLYSLRDFFIFNKDGQIICKATTAWLPINIKSKRIIDTSGLPAPINYQENESAIDELPQKFSEPDNKIFILKKKMRYTDLDLNQHVNNIKYIELVMDSFPKDQFEKFQLKTIEINFISESKYDDEIEIYKSGTGPQNIFSGINPQSKKIVFQSNLFWDEINFI